MLTDSATVNARRSRTLLTAIWRYRPHTEPE